MSIEGFAHVQRGLPSIPLDDSDLSPNGVVLHDIHQPPFALRYRRAPFILSLSKDVTLRQAQGDRGLSRLQ
jgi:hypothetical protein